MKNILQIIGRQEYLRKGIRERLIRIFDNPTKRGSKIFSEFFFNFSYTGNLSNFIDWNVFFYGAYAKQELVFIKEVLSFSSDSVLLDIGANVGHHSLFASKYAMAVHAFEPYRPLVEQINQKISQNEITNISVYPVGIGEKDETSAFWIPATNNLGTGTFHKNSDSTTSLILPVYNGDKYLETQKINKVDFIKIDIEGHEPFALKGLRQTLCKRRPVVFFEWSANDRNIHNQELIKLFPEKYFLFDFVADRKFLKIFNKAAYILKKNMVNSDGNKVAFPAEKLEVFAKKFPKKFIKN